MPQSEAEEPKIVNINLYKMAGVGIIVPHPCGVFYTNQVGGYACSQRTVEGFFVPLNTGKLNECPLADELLEYFFTDIRWRGHCSNGIDADTAKYLDKQFQKYKDTSYLRVDQTMLDECAEAWIYVTLNFPDNDYYFSPIGAKTAVLTWPNSD